MSSFGSKTLYIIILNTPPGDAMYLQTIEINTASNEVT